jgi:hypothetical protein
MQLLFLKVEHLRDVVANQGPPFWFPLHAPNRASYCTRLRSLERLDHFGETSLLHSTTRPKNFLQATCACSLPYRAKSSSWSRLGHAAWLLRTVQVTDVIDVSLRVIATSVIRFRFSVVVLIGQIDTGLVSEQIKTLSSQKYQVIFFYEFHRLPSFIDIIIALISDPYCRILTLPRQPCIDRQHFGRL